jgi:tetratricopeptide (TPR) repeat protein
VPDDCAWLKARGDARLRLGRLDGALADYVEAARLDPRDGAAFLGQALVYITRGDAGMALAYLDRAVALAPKLADAHYQRARCNQRLDQIDDAVEDVSRALELDPAAVAPRRLRAELFFRLGRAEDAYADIAQLVNRAPTDPVVYHLRGKLEFRRSRFEAAVADLTTALKLDPHFAEALADRAGVYRALARHKEALADLTTAVHLDPKYAAEYLVQLGIVRGATGEFNGAIADFIVALQLDPANKAAIRGKELVTQLRDAHGAAGPADDEDRLDQSPAGDRGVTVPGATKRQRLWRSYVQPDALPAAAPLPAGRGTGTHRPVGLVLEPEPDDEVDLAPERPRRDPTDFEVDTGFEEPDPDDMILDLDSEPDADDTPAPSRKTAVHSAPTRPEKPAKTAQARKARSQPRRAAKSLNPATPKADSKADRAYSEPRAPRQEEDNEAKRKAAELAAVASRAEELRRKNEEEERKEAARVRAKDDPEERAERRKRNRRYGIIAAGALVILYYGVQGVMALMPPPENPFETYTADEFVGRYSKNADEANDKFADQRVALKAKLKINRPAKTGAGPVKVYLDVPGDLKVEVLFGGEDVTENLKEGTEYLINGKVSRFKPGAGLVLKESNVMGAPG